MRYIDLVNQTFDFPTEIFKLENDSLTFNDIPLLPIIEQYGTPLRITYLPKISEQIKKCRKWFQKAMKKNNYEGNYTYFYCTKSSHFKFILEEVLKNQVEIETSSAYDLFIMKKLIAEKKINKQTQIICNGYKRELYTNLITQFLNEGYNVTPILDNMEELQAYHQVINPFNLGIRVAADEKPNFAFYTSRLGIRYNDIVDYYKENIATHPQYKLKMLHFFINSGIKDTAYYWSELNRIVYKYCELKKICPDLDTIDIGGGFPIQNNLHFDYDYEHIINEIVKTIKYVCDKNFVPTPHIATEFGSFTVGESGCHIFSVAGQKLQNERELWYMIDGSFITHLPDTWGIGQKFLMLPINNWENESQKVNLGGVTCDSDDFYNSDAYTINIYLPKINGHKQYIGFFHTGAYQESLAGYGGTQHCLIPAPRHVLVDVNKKGEVVTTLFQQEQDNEQMLKILGY
jgi:arginine decarboxylase